MFFRAASGPLSLIGALMVLLNGLSARAFPSLSADAPLPDTLPGLVSRRIQLDLARRLNVPTSSIVIKEASGQTWRDQCMELARPNERCEGREMKGWQVKVESSQQQWVYRSDRIARRLRQEPLPEATPLTAQAFSPSVSQTLLETVSRQVQQPVEDLQILEVRAAMWDGCLGIAEAGSVCIEQAIPGFRVIVNNGQKGGIGKLQRESWPEEREFQSEWVYHLNADASQIVYNAAASDEQGTVGTWFRSTKQPTVELAPSAIFQAHVYGFGGRHTTALTADGQLIYIQEGLTDGTVIEQVSPEDIDAFQAILQQQQFSQFDQLAYENEDFFIAMDSSIILSTADVSVDISAADRDLPQQLQTILKAWTRISQGQSLEH